MKTPLSLKLVFAVASLTFSNAALSAATSFSSNLSSLGANLEVADADGFGSNGTTSNEVTLSSSGATFSAAGGNEARNYIRTTGTDYGTVDFTAEVTWNGSGTLFLGFGGGNVGTYGCPDWDVADSLWLELNGTAVGAFQTTVQGSGRTNANIGAFSAPIGGGLTTIRWQYTAATKSIQFFADNNRSGAFVADASSPIFSLTSNLILTDPSDRASIFFGGQSGTFTDFAV
ncbi:MAG: hypothetical protein ABW223_10065, partial [Rariglobus sp.]